MSDPVNVYWPLPGPDALGQLVGADDVRNAVKDTIDTWSPYYLTALSQRLNAAERIGGANQNPNPLPLFGTWVNLVEDRSFGTGQPAGFIVTVPATVGKPDVQGNRSVRATFRAQVIIQVFGTDWQSTADLVSYYEKAVRWCVLQHRSLGDFATGTTWIGNQYSGKEHTSTRTYGECVMAFDVVLPDVIDLIGPTIVPVPPGAPPNDPTVDDVIVTLTKVPDDSLPTDLEDS